MTEQTKTVFVNVAAIAVISLLLIAGNTLWRQRTQFLRGEEAMGRGDVMAAVSAYEAALHMYTPLGPHVERSALRLWEIGAGFERGGDTERALIAYRALRSSFYAAAWLVQPGREWIARCDMKIAMLAGRGGPR